MSLTSHIESILFVASKPLTFKKLASSLDTSVDNVEEAIETLLMKYNRDDSGIHILHEANTVQMSTNATNAEAIEGFVKDEVTGELTKAQLETLTVIAYRSPITRTDLEQIRGVNCAIILRNLMMRGLVTAHDSKDDILQTYILTPDALSHLGVSATAVLPGYETLHAHDHIEHSLHETSLT